MKLSPDRRPEKINSAIKCDCKGNRTVTFFSENRGGRNMGKDLTEIVFILDRSGSMSGLEADTIGGFNSMIQKQKKERGRPLGAE